MSRGQARDIGFPLVTDSTRWEQEATRRLRGVPRDMVDRIHACQPFQHATDQERERDALRVLHELDVQDKHRLALSTQVALTGVGVDQAIDFLSADAASRNAPPDVVIFPAAFEDGALVATGTTKDPIDKVSGKLNLEMEVSLEVRGSHHKMSELLQGLAVAVESVIAFVVGWTSVEQEPPSGPGNPT